MRAHVVISGRVQGVFFRHTASERARARGLAGWVRNLADGRVEAVFQGSKEDVENLIRWCEQGPRGAAVKAVDVTWEDPEGGDPDFRVRG